MNIPQENLTSPFKLLDGKSSFEEGYSLTKNPSKTVIGLSAKLRGFSSTLSNKIILSNSNNLSLLSDFIALKTIYSKSVITDYNPYSLSRLKLIGSSPNTVAKKIEKMILKGWARKEGNRLYLASKKELSAMYGDKNPDKTRRVRLTKDKPIKEQIQTHILKTAIEREKFKQALCKFALSNKGTNQAKARKLYKKFSSEETYTPYSSISKVFNTAPTTTKRTIKNLERKGLIEVSRKNVKVVGKMSQIEFDLRHVGFKYNVNPHYCFLHKGYLFYSPPNKYTIVP